MSALFAEIQKKGDGITGGLKHVTDDQKIFKQEKKDIMPVSFDELDKKKAAAEKARHDKEEAAAGGAVTKKKAAEVLTLEANKKWLIENHSWTPDPNGDEYKTIKIDQCGFHMGMYIANCDHCFIEVTGKVNSVAIVGCNNCRVMLKSIVGVVEVTKCHAIDVQVAQQLPSAQLDGSHDINMFLLDPELSREGEIVTSGCSGVNINFPDKDDSQDLLEKPIAEQFVSHLVRDPKTGKVKVAIKASDI